MMNSGHTSVGSVVAYQSSAIEHATSPPIAKMATFLRSNRSATVPVTSTSSAAGRNSQSPIQPRSAARPVMS